MTLELNHGGFLFDEYWLDMVLNTLGQMNTGLKKGIGRKFQIREIHEAWSVGNQYYYTSSRK